MCNREIAYPYITSVILFSVSLATFAYAVTLHEEDYFVTNIGMKNGNKFVTVGGATGRLMILHWMTKVIRHMFSTMTRALPKYPLPKVVKKFFNRSSPSESNKIE